MKQKIGRWCMRDAAGWELPVGLPRRVLLAAVLTIVATQAAGCSDMVLFNPRGPVGEIERFIILMAFALMLLVVVPVILMTLWFAWRYRASNRRDHDYAPKWSYSRSIEISIWVVPAIIVTALTVLIWNNTYRLDPFTPLDSTVKPLKIEVVSLDWKWLFIYPEENVAVVGELVFPTGTPLAFRLTSDSVMTSFFIPQLGSQVYAMAGMETRLHLMANAPGVFFGQNQQFSGSGYAHMTFPATAVSPEDYSAWLDNLRQSPEALDLHRYEELAKPSHGYPVTYFSSAEPNLFSRILAKFGPHGPHGPHGPPPERNTQPPPPDRNSPEDGAGARREEVADAITPLPCFPIRAWDVTKGEKTCSEN